MTAQCLMEWAKASGVPLRAVEVSGVERFGRFCFLVEMRIAREKLRDDLDDRRFAIYMASDELLEPLSRKTTW